LYILDYQIEVITSISSAHVLKSIVKATYRKNYEKLMINAMQRN